MLVFELKDEVNELESLKADEITIVNDQRFTWKGREKLSVRAGSHKFEPGYQLSSYVQLEPPVAATSLDFRSDWRLYALGTSYGFFLYDYANKHSVVNKCTLNVQDFAIVSGDAAGAGAMSRKKSFRKSLRESFRRLRRGRSQRNQPIGGDNQQANKPPAFGRVITGVRTLNAPSTGAGAATTGAAGVGSGNEVGVHHRNVFSNERQVEQKVELSSIVRCITLTSAVITNNPSFKPTLWVGTNSGQVLVYAITLASEQQDEEQQPQQQQQDEEQQQQQQQQDQQQQDQQAAAVSETSLTTAKLAKEIQLKHRAPIIAIITSPEAPPQSVSSVADSSVKSSPEKQLGDKDPALQARVFICSEEQFKVFNLPNLKPFCKFKLTAHEGLRAKKINITHFANNSQSDKDLGSEQVGAEQSSLFEPYMVCMSNQGDCAIYSVPDLKRQAQIQVCKREDINGITSTMLTNYGEGFYLKSSSNFLRFSISTQRVLRVLSVV